MEFNPNQVITTNAVSSHNRDIITINADEARGLDEWLALNMEDEAATAISAPEDHNEDHDEDHNKDDNVATTSTNHELVSRNTEEAGEEAEEEVEELWEEVSLKRKKKWVFSLFF